MKVRPLICREAKEKAGPTAQKAADNAKGKSKDYAAALKGNVDTGTKKAKDTLSAGEPNRCENGTAFDSSNLQIHLCRAHLDFQLSQTHIVYTLGLEYFFNFYM